MKNILYTIILSFLFSSSYAGSVDGKGLVCFSKLTKSAKGYWFSNGRVYEYDISGYGITIDKPAIYYEKGTSEITWHDTSSGMIVFLNRKTLTLGSKMLKSYTCSLIKEELEIYDYLHEVIKDARDSNQL